MDKNLRVLEEMPSVWRMAQSYSNCENCVGILAHILSLDSQHYSLILLYHEKFVNLKSTLRAICNATALESFYSNLTSRHSRKLEL